MRVENSANSIVQVSHRQGLTGKTKSASEKVVQNIEIELIHGKTWVGGEYGMTTKGE